MKYIIKTPSTLTGDERKVIGLKGYSYSRVIKGDKIQVYPKFQFIKRVFGTSVIDNFYVLETEDLEGSLVMLGLQGFKYEIYNFDDVVKFGAAAEATFFTNTGKEGWRWQYSSCDSNILEIVRNNKDAVIDYIHGKKPVPIN